MVDDIKKVIKDTARATAKEVRHEFDLVIEDLEENTLKAINEQIASNTVKLTKVQKTLDGHTERLENIDTRLGSIETTLQGTETEKPLKQRVEDLESKVNAG